MKNGQRLVYGFGFQAYRASGQEPREADMQLLAGLPPPDGAEAASERWHRLIG